MFGKTKAMELSKHRIWAGGLFDLISEPTLLALEEPGMQADLCGGLSHPVGSI